MKNLWNLWEIKLIIREIGEIRVGENNLSVWETK